MNINRSSTDSSFESLIRHIKKYQVAPSSKQNRKIIKIVSRYLLENPKDLTVSQKGHLRSLMITVSPHPKIDKTVFNFRDFLGKAPIPENVFAHLDQQVPEILTEAKEGNPEALQLLKQCADSQGKRCSMQDQSGKTAAVASELFSSPSSSSNAYLALVEYHLSKNQIPEALNCWYQAVQSTNYSGNISDYPQLKEAVDRQCIEHFRRLPSETKNYLLNNPLATAESLNALLQALKNDDYVKALDIPDVMNVVREGVKQGKISLAQKTTLNAIWSYAKECPDGKRGRVDLFDEQGQASQEAKDIIALTMFLSIPEEGLDFLKNNTMPQKTFLDQQGVEQMLERLKDVPPSERCFYLIPDEQPFFDLSEVPKDPKKLQGITISQVLNYYVKFNVFSRVFIDDQLYRMIPSLSMVIAFLQTCYERPFLPSPVEGPSTVEDIANKSLEFARDVGVPSEHAPLPPEADGFQSPLSVDFMCHDYYHCMICSEVSNHTKYESHSKIFYDISAQIKSSFPFEDPKNWVAEALYNKFLDLDLKGYYKQSSQVGAIFWEQIGDIANDLINNRQMIPMDLFQARQIIHQIVNFAMDHEEEWKTRYGIARGDLAQVVKNEKLKNDKERNPAILEMGNYLKAKKESSVPLVLVPPPAPSMEDAKQHVLLFCKVLMANFSDQVKFLIKAYPIGLGLSTNESRELDSLDAQMHSINVQVPELIAHAKRSIELIEQTFMLSKNPKKSPYRQVPASTEAFIKQLKAHIARLESLYQP